MKKRPAADCAGVDSSLRRGSGPARQSLPHMSLAMEGRPGFGAGTVGLPRVFAPATPSMCAQYSTSRPPDRTPPGLAPSDSSPRRPRGRPGATGIAVRGNMGVLATHMTDACRGTAAAARGKPSGTTPPPHTESPTLERVVIFWVPCDDAGKVDKGKEGREPLGVARGDGAPGLQPQKCMFNAMM